MAMQLLQVSDTHRTGVYKPAPCLLLSAVRTDLLPFWHRSQFYRSVSNAQNALSLLLQVCRRHQPPTLGSLGPGRDAAAGLSPAREAIADAALFIRRTNAIAYLLWNGALGERANTVGTGYM